MLTSVLYLLFIVSYVTAQKSSAFENCGGSEVQEVVVIPCNTAPCQFAKGSSPEIKISFISNQDADKLKLSITGDIAGIKAKFPGLKPNGCQNTGLECPIKKFQNYTFGYKLNVLPFFPSIQTIATVILTGPQEQLLCVKIPVEVV